MKEKYIIIFFVGLLILISAIIKKINIQEGLKWTPLENKDYNANDISNGKGTLEEATTKCANDKTCVGFNWNRTTGQTDSGNYWYKHDLGRGINGNSQDLTGYTFYTKDDEWTPLENTDYPGNDITSGGNGPLAEVKAKCADDPTCKGFNWNSSTGDYNYKNALGTRTSPQGLTFYTKVVTTTPGTTRTTTPGTTNSISYFSEKYAAAKLLYPNLAITIESGPNKVYTLSSTTVDNMTTELDTTLNAQIIISSGWTTKSGYSTIQRNLLVLKTGKQAGNSDYLKTIADEAFQTITNFKNGQSHPDVTIVSSRIITTPPPGTTRTTPPGTTPTGTTRTTPPGTTPPGTTPTGTTRTTPPGTTPPGTTRTTPPGTTPPGTTPPGTTRTTPPGTTPPGRITRPPDTTIPVSTKSPVIVDESALNKSLSKAKTYINSVLSGYFPTEVSTGGEDILIEKDYVQDVEYCDKYNNRIPTTDGYCTNYCSMNGYPNATLYNSENNTCT